MERIFYSANLFPEVQTHARKGKKTEITKDAFLTANGKKKKRNLKHADVYIHTERHGLTSCNCAQKVGSVPRPGIARFIKNCVK